MMRLILHLPTQSSARGKIVDKSMNRNENCIEVGTLYLRTLPVSILNS